MARARSASQTIFSRRGSRVPAPAASRTAPASAVTTHVVRRGTGQRAGERRLPGFEIGFPVACRPACCPCALPGCDLLGSLHGTPPGCRWWRRPRCCRHTRSRRCTGHRAGALRPTGSCIAAIAVRSAPRAVPATCRTSAASACQCKPKATAGTSRRWDRATRVEGRMRAGRRVQDLRRGRIGDRRKPRSPGQREVTFVTGPFDVQCNPAAPARRSSTTRRTRDETSRVIHRRPRTTIAALCAGYQRGAGSGASGKARPRPGSCIGAAQNFQP